MKSEDGVAPNSCQTFKVHTFESLRFERLKYDIAVESNISNFLTASFSRFEVSTFEDVARPKTWHAVKLPTFESLEFEGLKLLFGLDSLLWFLYESPSLVSQEP